MVSCSFIHSFHSSNHPFSSHSLSTFPPKGPYKRVLYSSSSWMSVWSEMKGEKCGIHDETGS